MKLTNAIKSLLDMCVEHGHEADHFVINRTDCTSRRLNGCTDDPSFLGIPIHVGELRRGAVVSLIPKPYSH